MKKYIYITILMLLPVMTMADNYSQLWKRVEKAQEKDQPQSVLTCLNDVAQKAEREREWGHWLKAELEMVDVQRTITPDSLKPQLLRFEAKAAEAENKDAVLGAVYSCVLGHVYGELAETLPQSKNPLNETMTADDCRKASQEYFAKATSNLDLLAKENANEYEPLLDKGSDSRIFGNDLLHVVMFEAKQYQRASNYYKEHGNDAAACISAFYQLQRDRFDDTREIYKSKYKARLDSLISVYPNIPETGEVAIERFTFMDQATDATAQEKIEYIDKALRQWPTWPRMAILKNARARITLPSFHVQLAETSLIPNKQIPVVITSLINLNKLTMTVTKVDMTGAQEFDPSDANDMKMIRSLMAEKPLYVDSHDYYGLPEYKEVRDTLTIIPLPVGIYLVEFTTDNKDVAAERVLLHVSNLRLLDMDMPDRQVRLITVDATTGKPVGGAKITLKFSDWVKGKRQETEEVLTTDDEGEVTFSAKNMPRQYRVTTSRDKAMEWSSISTSWWSKQSYEERATDRRFIQIYKDRAIYRPKQTVQTSILMYENNSITGEAKVIENVPVSISLCNTNGKTVETVEAKTNEWGVATANFNLPDDGKTGICSILAVAKDDKNTSKSDYFKVEEYKRPTFVVNIDDYDKAYKAGDTIVVRGWAKTYAGVPVQNAKVTYRANSRMSAWWARYINNDNSQTKTLTDEVTTAEDGSFEMRLPIVLQESQGHYKWSFCECGLTASVTSLSGETHEAHRYFPVSNKQTVLLLNGFDEKQCLENPKQMTIRYVNNAGTPIESELHYNIDGRNDVKADANQPLTIDYTGIEKGEHILRVYCQNDSIEQKFVLFSLDDKQPVIDTDAWYYDTPGTYDSAFNFEEGKPVRMQLGTSRDDQTVFYAIISEKAILEEGVMVLNNENLNRSFTYKEEWGDGIAVRYSWARNGKVYTFHERLHKPERNTGLQLEWATFRDKVSPGEKEQWTIKVKNADGTPASAHMIATIYDKSLEGLVHHTMFLYIGKYAFTPQIYTSQRNISSMRYLYGEQTYNPLSEPSLSFYTFSIPSFYGYSVFGGHDRVFYSLESTGNVRVRGMANAPVMMMAKTAAPQGADAMMANAVEESAVASTAEDNDETADVEVRENLNETAAFLPMLTTDKDGTIAIKFTLPESLTTWHFLGLAHNKIMDYGTISGDAIAQKQLMVQPNMPRFLREGDKTKIMATVTNTTSSAQSGTATLQLLNAETEKVVYQSKKSFTVKADNTSSVTFDVPSTLAPEVYICKIVAKSKSFSDGEQQYLPVISKKEVVTTTRAITQTKVGRKTVNLNELFGKNTQHEKVSIEYTNNPAWMMVDALSQSVADCRESDNAINYSAAIYSATLVDNLMTKGAKAELNSDTLGMKIASYVNRLKDLQNTDGSFSWYPDMPGSPYITLEVARNFVRMGHLIGSEDATKDITAKAMKYLAGRIDKEVAELKKEQDKGVKNPMPSELAMDYLYLQALYQGEMGHEANSNVRYLFGLLKNVSRELSIYGKANLAVAFALTKTGTDKDKAAELLESVMQYSVCTEEMGRYFDTPKALLSWRNYKIPTETAAIEAFLAVKDKDVESVAEMRQWLLNEKRTQRWDTPINTSSAIYAFLDGNMDALNDVEKPTKILLDDKTLLTSGKERGYFKTMEVGRHQKVVFDKQQDGMSFGAVTTQALQSVSDVEAVDDNSLHVKREVITPNKALKIGDKVQVKITVTADRDMDFIEVEDNRAACLEPVNQLSGYRYGYYTSPRDTKTCYYICHLAKGMSVVMDTEYYVDRKGSFESGLLTAKCAYAPEFTARKETVKFVVE